MAIKTMLRKNLQDIYLVKFNKATIYGEADTYSEPVHYRLNISTTPSYTTIQQFGTEARDLLEIIDNVDTLKDFKIGDRIYYNKPLLEEHDELQESEKGANYEVISEPKNTLNIGTLVFSKLAGK